MLLLFSIITPCCDLEDYPGSTPEDHIKSLIYQRVTEIVHKGEKEDIPTLRRRDITLVIKYVNEVNKVLKRILVRNLSEVKYVARARALLVCEKVAVKTDHTINKKKPFWKQRIEKHIYWRNIFKFPRVRAAYR